MCLPISIANLYLDGIYLDRIYTNIDLSMCLPISISNLHLDRIYIYIDRIHRSTYVSFYGVTQSNRWSSVARLQFGLYTILPVPILYGVWHRVNSMYRCIYV